MGAPRALASRPQARPRMFSRERIGIHGYLYNVERDQGFRPIHAQPLEALWDQRREKYFSLEAVDDSRLLSGGSRLSTVPRNHARVLVG